MSAKQRLGAPVSIELPEGVSVGEKPANIELLVRGKSKWVAAVENMRRLKTTESLRYDLTDSIDLKKAKVAIYQGLRATATSMGEKKKMKCALIGHTLYVWLA